MSVMQSYARFGRQAVPGDRCARILSSLLCPPLAATLLAPVGWARGGLSGPAVLAGLTLLLLNAAVPAAFVVLAVRRGWIADYWLARHQDRHLVAFLSVLCAVVAVLACGLGFRQPVFTWLSLAAMLQFLLLAGLTLFSKVSYHAAVVSGVATATLVLVSPPLGVALYGLALCAGWSRLHLRRHTPLQVGAGLLSAFVVPVASLFLPLPS
jgi:hypothetical protein